MSKILASQAATLLKTTKDEKQKDILRALAKEKNPQCSISALRALMFSFPVDQQKSAYIDFLARRFPEVLCPTLLNPNQRIKARSDLREALLAKLSGDEKFAQYFLNYYTAQKIEGEIKDWSSFDSLSRIPTKLLSRYSRENKKDRAKFFGGFGKGFVLSILGYGAIYKFLYGSTDDEIADRLQPILQERMRFAEKRVTPSNLNKAKNTSPLPGSSPVEQAKSQKRTRVTPSVSRGRHNPRDNSDRGAADTLKPKSAAHLPLRGGRPRSSLSNRTPITPVSGAGVPKNSTPTVSMGSSQSVLTSPVTRSPTTSVLGGNLPPVVSTGSHPQSPLSNPATPSPLTLVSGGGVSKKSPPAGLTGSSQSVLSSLVTPSPTTPILGGVVPKKSPPSLSTRSPQSVLSSSPVIVTSPNVDSLVTDANLHENSNLLGSFQGVSDNFGQDLLEVLYLSEASVVENEDEAGSDEQQDDDQSLLLASPVSQSSSTLPEPLSGGNLNVSPFTTPVKNSPGGFVVSPFQVPVLEGSDLTVSPFTTPGKDSQGVCDVSPFQVGEIEEKEDDLTASPFQADQTYKPGFYSSPYQPPRESQKGKKPFDLSQVRRLTLNFSSDPADGTERTNCEIAVNGKPVQNFTISDDSLTATSDGTVTKFLVS